MRARRRPPPSHLQAATAAIDQAGAFAEARMLVDRARSYGARAAIAVAHFDRLPPCTIDDWLTGACQAVALVTDERHITHASLFSEGAIPVRAAVSGVAARAGPASRPPDPPRRCLGAGVNPGAPAPIGAAILAHLLAGRPEDDLPPHPASIAIPRRRPEDPQPPGPQPVCFARAEVCPDAAWSSLRYRRWRRAVGLHEFVRVAVPFEDFDGAHRHLLLQIDGVDEAWAPERAFLDTVRVIGACFFWTFRDRFVAPAARRNAVLSLLSPIRRQIAEMRVRGMTEGDIARTLDRSKHTIRDHLKSIYATLDVSTCEQLAARLAGAALTPPWPPRLPPTSDEPPPRTAA